MSPWFYLILLAALVAIGPVLVTRCLSGRREPVVHATFADVLAMEDTDVFDPRPPLEVVRLRSVQPRRLSVVSDPPADDAWLEDLLCEDPLQLPSQRRPGAGS